MWDCMTTHPLKSTTTLWSCGARKQAYYRANHHHAQWVWITQNFLGRVPHSPCPHMKQMPYKIKWRLDSISTLASKETWHLAPLCLGVHSRCPFLIHTWRDVSSSGTLMGTKAGNSMIQQQSLPPYQSVLFSTKEYLIYKTPDADIMTPSQINTQS